ncbi:MAG: PspA/IM30 family protein [bacterium]
MIFGKFWAAIRAQLNKIANLFYEPDPVAQLRYEYDKAVEELKTGREGLEQYAGLVQQVSRRQQDSKRHVDQLEAQTKAYLKAGDRTTAGKFALELQKAKDEAKQADEVFAGHQEAYNNNLKKIKHANEKLMGLRQKIDKYDAELKMSAAEAEIAKLSETFEMNVTTDFGQLESVIQKKIDENRGKAKVAQDLSSRGVAELQAEENMQAMMAEDALQAMEVEMGLRSPETTPVSAASKDLGPAEESALKDLGPAESQVQSN